MFTGAASDGIAIGDVQRVLRGRNQIFKISNTGKSTDLGNLDTEDLAVDQQPNRGCLRAAALESVLPSRCCTPVLQCSGKDRLCMLCDIVVNNQLGFKKSIEKYRPKF